MGSYLSTEDRRGDHFQPKWSLYKEVLGSTKILKTVNSNNKDVVDEHTKVPKIRQKT